MSTILYTLIIYPLESIIELIYLITYKLLNENPGSAVVAVSFFVNILTLPIYNMAENHQIKERLLQKKLKPKVKDIKAVFKGDERYMILSAYYRQNNYHPLYSLRGMLSLLFQIPFFIAAYNFLNNLTALQGASFFFIKDLSKQDGLFNLGNYTINALPFVMTAINFISTAVYTKGSAFKEKLQLYITAFLFLFLLYDSPSGLVFYWTLNNVFSLIKNIISKFEFKTIKPKQKIFAGILLFVIIILCSVIFTQKRIVAVLSLITAGAYFLLFFDLNTFVKGVTRINFKLENQECDKIFYFSAISAALLFGILIPSSLISSSVQEFSYTMQYRNPFYLLWITFLQSAGFLLVWPVIIYKLSSSKLKFSFSFFAFVLLITSTINVFLFQGNYGSLTGLLSFTTDEALQHSLKENILNISILLLAFFIIVSIFKSVFAKKIILFSCIIFLSFFIYSSINAAIIYKGYVRTSELINADKQNNLFNNNKKVYSLSKSKQNVIVFMLDRMPGIFVPSIFEDFPEIAEKFEGFVLYPNTISFAGHTYKGAPAIYGGYEYTPEAFEKNSDSTRDMFNESLCVLPRVFSEHGWTTVITDASLANHSWIPDNTIFDPYKKVKALNMEGKYVSEWIQKHNINVQGKILPYAETLRNTIRFSFFKASPYFLRKKLYNKGRYLQSGSSTYGLFDFITKAAPLEFIKNDIEVNAEENCFNLIVNNTPHTPLALPQAKLFCTEEFLKKAGARCKNEITFSHYIADIYTLKIIGEMLDFLRENEIYANTRIIFSADHAFGNLVLNGSNFNTDFKNKYLQQSYYMPILMMKDFGTKGGLEINMEFMTNADVPILATENLENINQINPFTNKNFKEVRNKDSFVISNIIEDDKLNLYLKNKNIFDEDNWYKE